MSKQYQCNDCEIGFPEPCTSPYWDNEPKPNSCVFEDNGRDCEWRLVERNSPKAEPENSTTNTSSPKLPELEEIVDDAWVAYKKSTWTYPPSQAVIRHVLEFITGKIGR